MRSAFFHEDDYCQLEILPLSAKEYCIQEMAKINKFSEDHRDGDYFTDIYVRKKNPYNLEELSLRSEQLDEALSFLPAYEQIETGTYSYTYPEPLKATFARGNGPRVNVFWSVNENGLINTLWLDLGIMSKDKETWQNILVTIGKLAPVVLADWGWCQCIDLSSAKEIEQYVENKEKSMIQFQEKIKKERENNNSSKPKEAVSTTTTNQWAKRCLLSGILCFIFGFGQFITNPLLLKTNINNKLLIGFYIYGMPFLAGLFGFLGIVYFLLTKTTKYKALRYIGLILSIMGIIIDIYFIW